MISASDPGPVIWLRPTKPARGPVPGYSRERIAEVAIAIADAEGIEAVSMRRIAAELGTGAMTLYRYLPAKEDLYAVMIDQAFGLEPQDASGDVRADLDTLARRYRSTLLRHPWLAGMAAGRPIMGPNLLRGNERDLALLDGHDLPIEEMLGVLNLIRHWVGGEVQDELADREAARRSGLDRDAWQARMAPYMRSLIETGEFPYLERMIYEAVGTGHDERFAHGLSILLDGIEARFAAIAPSRRTAD
ncbi:TetR/AcrR family transcriptional regulator [Microlunatus ginsengisoli]|uniref:TetR/AcrR family transcriptional regulator C-terminal domain-containing protein n=1 Tax=Microlunatus ginsengisoli TaxID=363863 RepID=A0ABP7AGP7_9ACTN